VLHPEATLGAHRHDQHVLDHLGGDEIEDLASEVGAIRPADSTTGDLAAAQVHALHVAVMHIDLEHQARARHVGDVGALDLEREVVELPIGSVEVRANAALHQVVEGPEDQILIVGLEIA
jgi:hypothetical protein